MAAPIGLTRAEIEHDQPEPPRAVLVAPPGAQTCRIAVPPAGDDCPAAATCRIVWHGEDVETGTAACGDCATRMKQLAESHRARVRIVPL